MTKEELEAFLRDRLQATQAACWIDFHEGVTFYDPNCQGELDGFEKALDALSGLHTTEFVAEWMEEYGDSQALSGNELAAEWREERG